MIQIVFAVLLALVAIPSTIVESALRRSQQSELAEGWGFIRLVTISLFAVLIGQTLAPIGYLWWVNVAVSIAITLVMVFLTQFLAKYLAHRALGFALLKSLDPVIQQVNLLFTPLTGPKLESPEEFEQELLESVEEFTETIVREVMVPRIDMATIGAESTLSKAMSVFLRTGYSRLPVIGKTVDDVLGVLYLKDVARLSFEQPAKLSNSVETLTRKAVFIPESKPVDDLLQEMQATATHIAVIVDEYGGVAGLVTMEDVIEEIVGEISDEYDRDIPDVVEQSNGTWLVNARYSLMDLGELFDIELDDEDVDSVGGLVAKELGRLPQQGESVTYSGLKFTVDRIEPRRKRLVTVLVERTDRLIDAEAGFDGKE